MPEENGSKAGDAAQSVLASLKSKEVVIPAVATAASVVAYAARKGASEAKGKLEGEAEKLGEEGAQGAKKGLKEGSGGALGSLASKALGRRARIEFHEQQRGEFTNVYLDRVEALDAPEESGAHEADEVAWKTAVDAAPWLLGESPPQEGVEPEELFEKLQPFKELVAEDIERGGDETESS